MKTTLLIKKHQRALAYLQMMDECVKRVRDSANSAEYHRTHTLLPDVVEHYVENGMRYTKLGIYITKRYANLIQNIA